MSEWVIDMNYNDDADDVWDLLIQELDDEWVKCEDKFPTQYRNLGKKNKYNNKLLNELGWNNQFDNENN